MTAQPPAGDASAARHEVLLQPGEFFAGDASHRVRTLLGSCVSVTLWCPLQRVGAMSHFLLASRGGAKSREASLPGLDAKYGDEALELMLRELGRQRIAPRQCEAKIFGGGDMFPAHRSQGMLAIGRRNGEAARLLLEAHGIVVASESLFGDGHRQIIFDIGTGDVWARQVPPQREAPVSGFSFPGV